MQELRNLLQGHETERVEFKETWQDNTALRTLAAFANTYGGTLLVGVGDRHQVVGWPGSNRDLEALASKIVDHLRVQPASIRVEELAGARVLVIDMPLASMPVAYRGHYYRRVGNTTQEIAPEELGHFLMQRMGYTWDGLAGRFGLDELDVDQVRHFVQLARQRLPLISDTEDVKAILQKLRLLADGQLTHAALLLFGVNPQRRFVTAQVHMGRFKDAITILDDKLIGGTLFQQLEQAMQLFRQYLQVRYEIPDRTEGRTGLEALQRREIWDYPLSALREAVINALIHRDYTSLGDIQIRVYDDSVIISNPGKLPEGLTVADLRQEGHDSIPRNPLLAQVFYYASLVEHWGTGTTRILQACREQGLPEPEFAAEGHHFSVTFLQNPYTQKRLEALGLNPRQIQAVQYVKEHGRISNQEYQQVTGVKKRQASVDLKELEEREVLVRVGSTGRGTYYVLKGAKGA